MPIVKKLRRVCRNCGILFIPTGKFSRNCGECKYELINAFRTNKLGKKYNR